jgi:hypothetical protein
VPRIVLNAAGCNFLFFLVLLIIWNLDAYVTGHAPHHCLPGESSPVTIGEWKGLCLWRCCFHARCKQYTVAIRYLPEAALQMLRPTAYALLDASRQGNVVPYFWQSYRQCPLHLQHHDWCHFEPHDEWVFLHAKDRRFIHVGMRRYAKDSAPA